MGRTRGKMPLFALWKSWRGSPLSTILKTRYANNTNVFIHLHAWFIGTGKFELSYIISLAPHLKAHLLSLNYIQCSDAQIDSVPLAYVYNCFSTAQILTPVCLCYLLLARVRCFSAYAHICLCVPVCRIRSSWFSPCRAVECCTRRSRLPAYCAARGSTWNQQSLLSCSSTKMSTSSTRTRHSHICHLGATRTQVCFQF